MAMLLERLCNENGVSGNEDRIRAIISEEIKPFADEIKILVSHETEDKTILDTEKNINYNYKFVQPIENISDSEETQRNIIRCVNFVKQHPDWRLSLQIHKYIAIK